MSIKYYKWWPFPSGLVELLNYDQKLMFSRGCHSHSTVLWIPEKMWTKSEVAQSCPTLCNPMDCSLSGSSVHGIFQAKVLVWVAISFSRGSSRPRDWTQVSCIAGRFFYHLSHIHQSSVTGSFPKLTPKNELWLFPFSCFFHFSSHMILKGSFLPFSLWNISCKALNQQRKGVFLLSLKASNLFSPLSF